MLEGSLWYWFLHFPGQPSLSGLKCHCYADVSHFYFSNLDFLPNARFVYLNAYIMVSDMPLKLNITKTEFLISFPPDGYWDLPIPVNDLIPVLVVTQVLNSGVILDSSSHHQIPLYYSLRINLVPDHLRRYHSDPNPNTSSLGYSNRLLTDLLAHGAGVTNSWRDPSKNVCHAKAPLCSKSSVGSHLTHSKSHGSCWGPEGPYVWPLTPLTSSPLTLALAYCAVDVLISLFLLEHTRTCLKTSLSLACGLCTHYSLCLECQHHSSLPICCWYLFKCHLSERLFLTLLYEKSKPLHHFFTPLSCFIFHHLT